MKKLNLEVKVRRGKPVADQNFADDIKKRIAKISKTKTKKVKKKSRG